MKRKSIEVRWHGRGGQGAVTAAMILAEAAFYSGYKGVTAAPFFGAERRGAPIIATTRFGREPVRTFSLVEQPDVVVVLDETLLRVVDVTAGMRPDGILLINTSKTPDAVQLKNPVNVATTNAGECARAAGDDGAAFADRLAKFLGILRSPGRPGARLDLGTFAK